MSWTTRLFGERRSVSQNKRAERPLRCEQLETRDLCAATASLAAGVLTVTGAAGSERININLSGNNLVVLDGGRNRGQFAADQVSAITINTGAGNDVVRIAANVLQPVTVQGGSGNDVFYAGGGPTSLQGGAGNDKLVGGAGAADLDGGAGNDLLYAKQGRTTFDGGPGRDLYYAVKNNDTTVVGANDKLVRNAAAVVQQLEAPEVEALLSRAAAASASNDAIIVIVDRNGRILGVRVEGGVSPAITATNEKLIFAIDGAVSLARTPAFFANDKAPLTSRTVSFISQSTITEREVNSDPSIPDLNSTLRGPGFVAPIRTGGHFPPGVSFTPQVDLFAIEHTNRDSVLNLPNGTRFNIDPNFIPPGKTFVAPESYGFEAFPDGTPEHASQSRGIATIPGGIPIFRNGSLIGGIGVFFPGTTGFASESNSTLSANYNPTQLDRSFEAEYIAFAAVGGSSAAGVPIGPLAGIPKPDGLDLPFGRIDLVGITLDIFGPNGSSGVTTLVNLAQVLGQGNPNSGSNVPIDTNGLTVRGGLPVPDGWLVTPHAGTGISAAEVTRLIQQGIDQANLTRAAIRLPIGTRTRMVFAVTDLNGNVLGLYRMPDATVFSIGVAVAKARNEAYYNDPTALQAIDQVPGIAAGVSFTNRTYRYLAEPRFPEGIDGFPPGPFSILNDGGASLFNGVSIGTALPASAFTSVLGYDAFNPNTNFRDPSNPENQNGVVFFPGSSGVYKGGKIAGGLGVSGDGVDQDDVVTSRAILGFDPPPHLRVDQFFFGGVRLPYRKFNRNPEG